MVYAVRYQGDGEISLAYRPRNKETDINEEERALENPGALKRRAGSKGWFQERCTLRTDILVKNSIFFNFSC